ncbi:MAG: KilA-N domain-containing protein, partial [Oscillospiraceae bacterium]|nr:KilA-N domain-containing protein [Oscillospiraceae bacterium]
RAANPNKDGNIRDYATLEQLVVLSNMESINALLIRQGLPQGERLLQLNGTAITQMKSLVGAARLERLL